MAGDHGCFCTFFQLGIYECGFFADRGPSFSFVVVHLNLREIPLRLSLSLDLTLLELGGDENDMTLSMDAV